ncbi:MAG: 2-C-methyl-D-erythritol 4-phosphate cytidylyltransferase [Arenicellales bacterium]|nr:2-C-methyl-D-erythritol 4-phosphate cytidylyltransferase [Arenicellales bacterium]
MNSPGIWALIPAAGSGTRFGSQRPKQYHFIKGKPVLAHTLERIAQVKAIRGIAVGLSVEDANWEVLEKPSTENLWTYTGGVTRADTVRRGLDSLSAKAVAGDWVLVHDAVRPCIQHADVQRLINEVAFSPEGGLLGIPVRDTIKRETGQGRVATTVPRVGLWRAQTPQLFPLDTLTTALDQAHSSGRGCTDEAEAIEQLSLTPRLVESDWCNLKITSPADLVLAELILEQQAIHRCGG